MRISIVAAYKTERAAIPAMARRNGYGSTYRGRQGSSPFLRGFVIFLAVLLALAIVLVIYLSRYLEYTDDGPKLRPPWLSEQGEASTPPDMSSLVIEGDPEEETSKPEETAAPEPGPEPEPTLPVLRALEVEPSALTGGTAAEQCAAAGADALVVRVKDKEGDLSFHSTQELAQEDMDGDPAFNEAVRQLSGADKLHLTARLSGFQDLWTSVYVREVAILYPSGRLWYDHAGISWMSLSNQRARSYLTELCLELAGMGFDEILLEHAGYPDQGRVKGIAVNENYPAEGRDAQTAAFLRELSEKLEEAGAVLSVQPEEAAPDGGAVSGVTPAALAGISGRVWLGAEADAGAWSAALVQAGMADASYRMVTGATADGGAPAGSVLLDPA